MKENRWQTFSNEIGGNFIKAVAWHSAKTEIEYKGFHILFDNYTIYSGKYSQILTRCRFGFNSDQNFRFQIYRNGIARTIEKIFGAQDIKIGFDDFDKSFIIKSNDDFKIFNLLKDEKIRNLIEAQDEVNIVLSNQKGIWEEMLPENEFELCYYTEKRIKNMEELKKIHILLQGFIDRLIAIKAIKIKDVR